MTDCSSLDDGGLKGLWIEARLLKYARFRLTDTLLPNLNRMNPESRRNYSSLPGSEQTLYRLFTECLQTVLQTVTDFCIEFLFHTGKPIQMDNLRIQSVFILFLVCSDTVNTL